MKTVYPLQTKFAGGIITQNAHKNSVLIIWANNDDSDEPVQTHSLVSALAVYLYKLC